MVDAVPVVDALDRVSQYLTYARVEKRLAARTLTLYALDLARLQEYARQVPVDLLAVLALAVALACTWGARRRRRAATAA